MEILSGAFDSKLKNTIGKVIPMLFESYSSSINSLNCPYMLAFPCCMGKNLSL
jgi:hypothetical protein